MCYSSGILVASCASEILKFCVLYDLSPIYWQEQLEKKKADYAEKVRNKVALIHKEAEEKRAMVEAKRGEEILKTDEMAAKYRATGHAPKKGFGCFGC